MGPVTPSCEALTYTLLHVTSLDLQSFHMKPAALSLFINRNLAFQEHLLLPQTVEINCANQAE